MGDVRKERATLIALAIALDSDDHSRIACAVQAVLDAAPPSIVRGEVGAVFRAVGRYADRVRAIVERSERERR